MNASQPMRTAWAAELVPIFARQFRRPKAPDIHMMDKLLEVGVQKSFWRAVAINGRRSRRPDVREAANRFERCSHLRQTLIAIRALNALDSMWVWPLMASLYAARGVDTPMRPSSVLDRPPSWGVNRKTRDGDTVLLLAAPMGKPYLLRFLLQCGANPAASDRENRSALHLTALPGDFHHAAENIAALLNAGAHVDARDALKQTPLHIAARTASYESIKILLAYGANPHAVNFDGRTPLEMHPWVGELWQGLKADETQSRLTAEMKTAAPRAPRKRL